MTFGPVVCTPHPKPTLNLPKPNHKMNYDVVWVLMAYYYYYFIFYFTVNGTAKAKFKTQDVLGMWHLVLWYVHHTLNLPKPNHKMNYDVVWVLMAYYYYYFIFYFTVNGTAKAKFKTQDVLGMWPLVLWYVHHTLNLPKPNHKINSDVVWVLMAYYYYLLFFFFTVNGTAKAKFKTQDVPGIWPLVLWYVHHTLNLPKPNHKINYGLFFFLQ